MLLLVVLMVMTLIASMSAAASTAYATGDPVDTTTTPVPTVTEEPAVSAQVVTPTEEPTEDPSGDPAEDPTGEPTTEPVDDGAVTSAPPSPATEPSTEPKKDAAEGSAGGSTKETKKDSTESPATARTERNVTENTDAAEDAGVSTMAVTSEPLVIGDVEIQATRLSTGTGHGTNSQCYISTRGGVTTGPLDDSADDDYVCTRDTVEYRFDYSIKDSDTPTSVRINLSTHPEIAILTANTTTSFCASDPRGAYTATRNNTAGTDCTFTFPANVSTSGSWPLVYQARVGTADVWVPETTVSVNDAAPQQLPIDGFQVLMTVGMDLWFYREPVKYVEIDGAIYARYTYGPVLRQRSMPSLLTSTHATKGNRYDEWDRIETHSTLHLGDMPLDGAIFTMSHPDRITQNPDGTFDFYMPSTTGSGASGMSLSRTFAHLIVDVPMSNFPAGVVTTWYPYFTDTTITGLSGVRSNNATCATCTYTHPDVFAGVMPQSGNNKPMDFQSGANGDPGYAGQTRPNNDWSLSAMDRQNEGDIFNKWLYDSDRATGGIGPAMQHGAGAFSSQRRPYDYPYWARFSLTSAPLYAADKIVFCDAFENVTREAANGMSFYNADVEPIIRRYDSATGAVVPITDYEVWFRTVGTADQPTFNHCADGPMDSTAGWTQDPTGADTMKVIIPAGFSLVGNGTLSLEAFMPFKTGPIESYPEWPGNYLIQDVGVGAIDPAPDAVFTNDDAVARWFWLGGRDGHASNDARFYTPGSVWNAPVPSEVTAGMDSSAGIAVTYGLRGGVGVPDAPNGIYPRGTITMDKCMLEPRNVHYEDNNGDPVRHPDVRDFQYTITPADYGPDGIPCTDDDGTPAQIHYSFTSSSSAPSLMISFDYTVSDLAVPSSTLSFSVESMTAFDEPGVGELPGRATATIRVVAPQTVAQSKIRTHVLEPVGTRVGWRLAVFNYTPDSVSDVEFIDVLPYNGDGRGTDLTAPLEDVVLTVDQVAGRTVYVTTADPATIPRDASDPLIDPSNTAMWCEYGTTGCAPNGDITAIYIYLSDMESEHISSVGVSVGTDNQSDGDILMNDMGVGEAGGVAQEVKKTREVRTELYVPRALSGTVYTDYDRDGAQETGEPGIENWDVTLSFPGEPNRTTTTDADGYYEFTELKPGTYTVTIEDPVTGQVITQSYTVVDPTGADTDVSQPATIAGADVTDVDFGLWEPSTLSGHVYIDEDRDGDLTGADTLQPGQEVTLTGPEGFDPTTTTTDDAGFYEFIDLLAGDYTVTWIAPDGHVVTQVFTVSNPTGIPSVDGEHATDPITVPYADTITDVDFGYAPAYVLSGTVYTDENRDGDMNDGETGIPDWNVTLTGPEGFDPRDITTDADGFYEFTHLVPGDYTVTITTPGSEYVLTQSFTVSDPSGETTDPTQPATIVDADVTEVDFGLAVAGQPISIVKIGADGQPIAGAEFTLVGPNGETFELVTDENGSTFTTSEDLIFGVEYTLTETKAPTGHELLAEPVVLLMTQDGLEVVSGDSGRILIDAEDTFRLLVGDVQNISVLPRAGGSGVPTGVLGSLVLIVAAGAVMIARNRRKEAGLT